MLDMPSSNVHCIVKMNGSYSPFSIASMNKKCEMFSSSEIRSKGEKKKSTVGQESEQILQMKRREMMMESTYTRSRSFNGRLKMSFKTISKLLLKEPRDKRNVHDFNSNQTELTNQQTNKQLHNNKPMAIGVNLKRSNFICDILSAFDDSKPYIRE